jgi:CBS domain-containing protein
MRVEDVMTTPVVTVDADATMAAALDVMLHERVGSLVVTTGSPPRKTGILTDSDVKDAFRDTENPLSGLSAFERLLFVLRRPMSGTAVREYMSSPLVTVQPDASLSDAVAKMNDHGIKHLVVTKHMRLEGIVTPSDVASAHDDIVRETRDTTGRKPDWRS